MFRVVFGDRLRELDAIVLEFLRRQKSNLLPNSSVANSISAGGTYSYIEIAVLMAWEHVYIIIIPTIPHIVPPLPHLTPLLPHLTPPHSYLISPHPTPLIIIEFKESWSDRIGLKLLSMRAMNLMRKNARINAWSNISRNKQK